MINNSNYDESNIVSLGIINGMRARPAMYIDSTGPKGVYKLVYEVLQNAIDECSVGRASAVSIKFDSKNHICEVEDNGAGIPIGKIHVIMTELHTGGKFDNKGYKVHNGQNGVGLVAVNSLSEFTDITVWRDNKQADFRYEKGYKTKENIVSYDGDKQGTKVVFKPDTTVLGDITFDYENILSFIDMIVSIMPGLVINVEIDGKKKVYQFNGSFSDYLDLLVKRNNSKKMIEAITFEDANSEMSLKLAFTFCYDLEEEKIISYVNNFPTPLGGNHVNGVRSALIRAITYYIQKNNCVPKSYKLNVTGADIIDNLFVLIIATHQNPQFYGQTKDRMTSVDYEKYCSTLVYDKFNNWCNNNPDKIDKLVKYAIKKARAKQAAKNAKEMVMAPNRTKDLLSNSNIDLKKFTDCKSNDPAKCELFLLEGDSAGGSVSQARDDNYQAFLRLRGKVLNVFGKSRLSQEQMAIIEVLGTGFGSKKDISKLKYNKIFLMMDADPDGSHIITLLLTFFLMYLPELIINGNIYIAIPPFYQVEYGNGLKLNILNDNYFNYYKRELAVQMFELQDYSGKKFSENAFRVYIDNLLGFNEMVDVIAKGRQIDPELLELVIREFDNVLHGKFKQFELYGFNTKMSKLNNELILEFNKEYNNYYLRIDNNFYNTVYKPLYNKMCMFKISNAQLKSNQTNEVYSGTSYKLCNIINGIMENDKSILKRYKGLGEMNPDVLRETAMDPRTRSVIKVTLENAKNAKYWTEVLMGDKYSSVKKNLFS